MSTSPTPDSTARVAPIPLVPRARIAAARVLVVGDVMLDRYWFGDVNRISPEAPVPVVHVQRKEDRLGGAANVARNAAALGAQAGLLCVVGHDEPGERVVELLGESRLRRISNGIRNCSPPSSCACCRASSNCCASTLKARPRTRC